MNVSANPLKILFVEDSPEDVALNLLALRELGRPLQSECVASEAALREALARFIPDIVLSDFSMPGFSGMDALRIVEDLTPQTPFLFVSGTIGEELAIEAMQRGASDYVLKDNLRRLKPAIERALRGAAETRERQHMQRALRESEERARSIIDTTYDAFVAIDSAGKIITWNTQAETMFGWSREEAIGRCLSETIIPPQHRDAHLRGLQRFQATGKGQLINKQIELTALHRDGREFPIELTIWPLATGGTTTINAFLRDVTLRVQQEAKIQQLARIQAVLGALGNAILRSSDTQALLDMTCRLLVEQGGFKAAVIGIGTPENTLVLSNHFGDAAVIETIRRFGAIKLGPAEPNERPSTRAFREGQKVIIADYTVANVPDFLREEMTRIGVAAQIALPIGTPTWGILGLYSGKAQEFDEDEIALLDRLTAEIDYAKDFIAKSERLLYLAYHNPATGLPGRAAFRELIVSRFEREPQAVVMADVDRFRYFNHSRGRAFGDQLLREVGARLRSLLPADALFTHPGDDAFVFAYPSDATIDAATSHVESLLMRCCEQPFLVDGEHVRAQLHASLLLAPAHGHTADAIEHDLVAVLAEAQKREQPVLAFTEELRSRATRRVELERDLRHALETDAFELYLQPKFGAASQRLTGAEALLRWRHPQRGMVSPAEFIPVLEESGLIIEVGAWVRRTALKISQRWRENGQMGLRIAVNVSARELRQLNFISECEEMLIPYVGEHDLDIEITESMLMDDIGQSIQVLQSLRDLGCKVAIDDFGTGYSSLNYLSRLPADTLKIDQSFVALLALSPDTLSLVTNIIGLAHSLGLKVCAEGVEDDEQAKLLRLLRCDELQGYLLGRPIPVSEFEKTFIN
jgi:PAS domain S-box-containing protein/diguanylate cyclase (GGDEF)-like protein